MKIFSILVILGLFAGCVVKTQKRKPVTDDETMRCRDFNNGFERCQNEEVVCYWKDNIREGGLSCWRK